MLTHIQSFMDDHGLIFLTLFTRFGTNVSPFLCKRNGISTVWFMCHDHKDHNHTPRTHTNLSSFRCNNRLVEYEKQNHHNHLHLQQFINLKVSQVNMSVSKYGLLESFLLLSDGVMMGERYLQELPDYTSPPLPMALDATPEYFRSDEVMDELRMLAGSGNCTVDGHRCHIPFPAAASSTDVDSSSSSKVGVVLYGGGLVDPRGYSPVASLLATRYGLPTVIPVFFNDIQYEFGSCNSGKVDLAKAEFPEVEKWVLAGHSFGGESAMVDMWDLYNNQDESAGGLVMLAADVQPSLGMGCGGEIDYSMTDIPMASVTGSLDQILNMTRWDIAKAYLSNETFLMDIYGGNHGYFGAYDDSGRKDALGQVDGTALIPRTIQFDLVAAAIAHVASRTGVPMPTMNTENAAAGDSIEIEYSEDEIDDSGDD